MRQRILNGEARAEGLTADQPALDAKRLPDLLEDIDVAANAVSVGILGRRRPAMPPKFDDDRSAKRPKASQIGSPLCTA